MWSRRRPPIASRSESSFHPAPLRPAQHLAAQVPELGTHALPLTGTGQITHALAGIGRLGMAIQQEVNAIEVLGSAYQESAAKAERTSCPAHAQSGITAMAKRHRVKAAVWFRPGRANTGSLLQGREQTVMRPGLRLLRLQRCLFHPQGELLGQQRPQTAVLPTARLGFIFDRNGAPSSTSQFGLVKVRIGLVYLDFSFRLRRTARASVSTRERARAHGTRPRLGHEDDALPRYDPLQRGGDWYGVAGCERPRGDADRRGLPRADEPHGGRNRSAGACADVDDRRP